MSDRTPKATMGGDKPWPWDDYPPGGVHPSYPILQRDTTATPINQSQINAMTPDTPTNQPTPVPPRTGKGRK